MEKPVTNTTVTETSTSKIVVLIRHGESLGQTASRRGVSRKDPSLQDCFLSDNGIYEAIELGENFPTLLSNLNLQSNSNADDTFDLVCVSPLTRAVSTCVLALGHPNPNPSDTPNADQLGFTNGTAVTNITTEYVCHPDLAETGGNIPENQGRAVSTVLRDVRHKLNGYTDDGMACLDRIDFSLLPTSWPDRIVASNSNSNSNRPKKRSGAKHGRHDGSQPQSQHRFLEWLRHRPERTVAVVCHFNVIHTLLRYRLTDRVENCCPIVCLMDTNSGDLQLLPH